MLVERACPPPPLFRPHFLARVFVVGFAGALLWFVCHPDRRSPEQVVAVTQAAEAPASPASPAPAVNVIDVAAAAASPELVAQLVRLGDGERITAVDDRAVESTL
ncbi:MAG TPA: hypothetical protein VN253_02240, partial [Kofleriaceae bacterium]|nr:hypothetical protein [Kofleriaceae bacterium]